MEDLMVSPGRIEYLRSEFKEAVEADNTEDLGYIVWEEMWDEIEDNAPEGYYFDSCEGDGACFGIWPITDKVW
jgi:hypothetical protein